MQTEEGTSPHEQSLIRGQQQYYEKFAPEYRDWIVRYMYPVRDALISLMKGELPKDRHFVELACGSGYFTSILSGIVRRVTAIDGSPVMLDIVRGLDLPNVETEQHDLFAWPPADSRTWTGAFMANWIAHVPPDQLPSFFARLSTALVPGATAYVVDVTPAEEFIERGVDTTPHGVPIVMRQVGGAPFTVVKKYWVPTILCDLVQSFGGWTADYTPVGAEVGRGFAFYRFRKTHD